jgi:predicted permease
MNVRIFIALLLSAIIVPASAWACAVCFSGDDDAVTHAFNWSVGFLLAAPYAIAGTIAACLMIAYRRAALKRAALDEEPLIWTEEERTQ